MSRSGGRPPLPRMGSSWFKGGGIDNNNDHRCRNQHQLLSSMAVATMTSPPPPSTATAVNNATIGAVAAASNAAVTTPSPLPPPSLLLQPLLMSLRLRRSCRWLVVVSSVAPPLLRCPLSEFVSPYHRAVVNAFPAGPPSPFAYRRQPLSCRSFTEH